MIYVIVIIRFRWWKELIIKASSIALLDKSKKKKEEP